MLEIRNPVTRKGVVGGGVRKLHGENAVR